MNGTRCRRLRISSITAILYQKFTSSHHLLAVEPDIEIAANAVDVGLGNPIRPSVFGIRMTEGDMNAGNFFVLQNVTDDVGAGDVCVNGKFTYAVAVFVRAGVSVKFVAQILVLRAQRSDPIVFHLDCERTRFEVAKALAQVIANHTIYYEDAIRVHRRGKDFAAGQVAPFFGCNDSAGLKPPEFWRKLSFKFGAVRCLAPDTINLPRVVNEALA